MKKQIKRFVLSVLVLTMVFSCIPATTYAKEQFKWSKSLVLKGKMYKTPDGDGHEHIDQYVVTIFSDRYTKATVQNYNGCVLNYEWCSESSNWRYKAEDKYGYPSYGNTFSTTKESKQKKNTNTTIELNRGWNAIAIMPCSNVTYKEGQEYKCKISVKEANILFIASDKDVNLPVGNAPMFSKKKFTTFKKWWNPQYYSLFYTDVFDSGISDLDADCRRAAVILRNLGYSDLSVKDFSDKIKKNVEKIYHQSNKNSKKFVSYQEAFGQYINSIDDLEERLIEKYGEDEVADYMDTLYDSLNWYKERVKKYK